MTQTNLATPTNAMPKGLLKGWILIVVAAIVAYSLYLYLPYDQNANKGLALLAFIGILWLTEAIHITITALLVPVMAVLLAMPMASDGGLVPITTQAALTTFADPVIFLWWAFGYFCTGDFCGDGAAVHVDFQYGHCCHDAAFGLRLAFTSGCQQGS